jgi:hypothetical protein
LFSLGASSDAMAGWHGRMARRLHDATRVIVQVG